MPVAKLEGQLVLVRYLDPVEEYVVLRNGDLHEFSEAQECNPCVTASPDGRYIVKPYLAPGDKFGTSVYDVVADTTAELPVPADLDGLGGGPFEPSTGRLMRVGWSDADPTKAGYYTSKVDGSDLRPLARIPEGQHLEALAWSADGGSLLTYHEDTQRTPPPHLGELLLLSLASDARRRLTPEDTYIETITSSATAATFSRDGSRVAFVARKASDPAQSAVFVADVAGGEPRQLTDWGLRTRSAIFSPTSDLILFDRADGGTSSIWVIKPDGSGERRLWSSSADGPGCCATWSPDGTQILFQRGDRARELWVMGADGVVQGRVAADPADWIWYQWTPAP
jgi:hypothetical protein